MRLVNQFKDAVQKAKRYTSDSRAFEAGDIFVALKGEKNDGAQFVQEILLKNPSLVIVSKDYVGNDPRLLRVDDIHAAHREITSLFRAKFQGLVIGIGGSSGKTTTKDFTYQLLASSKKTIKTQKSQNGELGLPKTMEQLVSGVETAIIEIGIDAPDEMIRHCDLVRPQLAALTSIGEEHLSRLKSINNVFKEECILLETTLDQGGKAFVPSSDEWLKNFPNHPRLFRVGSEILQKVGAQSPFDHPHQISNLSLAVALALEAGASAEKIRSEINLLKLPEGRGGERHTAKKQLLILDHYNSNPSSLSQGLMAAQKRAATLGMPLVLVLGDMLDLGEATHEAHLKMLPVLESLKAEALYLIGPEWKKALSTHGPSKVQAHVKRPIELLESSLKAQNLWQSIEDLGPSVILLKGSRGMALEKILPPDFPTLA